MKCKPDYAFKSEILRNHMTTLNFQKKIAQSMFYGPCNTKSYVLPYEFAIKQYNDFMENEPIIYKECEKINNASYKRKIRLEKRIKSMLLSGECLFLTFTFNDDCFNTTSADTRKQYVRRWLASYCTKYVANIDFGEKNGREHYHAVILANNVDYSTWHKHGAIKGKKIVLLDDLEQNSTTSTRLAKYVAKLTNHAIKETTKRNCMIYSRN